MKEYTVSKQFEEGLKKLGVVAGVGEDWFELGDPDPEDKDAICGVYAKNEEDGEKVMDWIFSHCDCKEKNDETD